MSDNNLSTRTGVIYEIGDLKEGVTNEREWKLRSVVIESTREYKEKKYSDFLEVTGFGQAVEGISELSIGDEVEVVYSATSRKKTSQAGNEYWGTSCKAISITPRQTVTTSTGADLEPKDTDLPF